MKLWARKGWEESKGKLVLARLLHHHWWWTHCWWDGLEETGFAWASWYCSTPLLLLLCWQCIITFLALPFLLFFCWQCIIFVPLAHPRCFLMRPLGTFVWPWFPCLPYCFTSCSPLFNIDFVMVHLILGHQHLETAPTLESLQQEADVINGMNIKKAFEFIEGPAHKLHVVLIYDLCIVVGVVH